MKPVSLFLSLCGICSLSALPCPASAATAPDGYTCSREGKIVLAVENSLLRPTHEKSIARLKADLADFSQQLPEAITDAFAADTVWVESGGDAAEYLTAESGKPHAPCVRIADAEAYHKAATGTQPNLLLNRLMQLYFDRYMDQDTRASLSSAYILSRKLHQNVYGTNGTKLVRNRRSDASLDKRSYFAELSEAYWGQNDFYPFDYQELERYDPRGFKILVQLYGPRTFAPNPHGIGMPPATLTQWLAGQESPLDTYYRKYLDAEGLAILSSRYVSDEALVQARLIINTMLSRIPEARTEMLRSHFRIGIIGAYENVTDMPECRVMPQWWPDTDWDARGRGYGATESIPLMTCGEENIIKIPGYNERYSHESIMVHEFAHNVDYGLRKARPEFEAQLQDAFRQAQNEGLWAGTYSMSNDAEYFAEGVQAWFNTCNMYVPIDGKRVLIKTRTQLKEYDPRLHALLSTVMPDDYLTGYHFEIGAPTAIESPASEQKTALKAYADHGKLVVEGAEQYTVISASGTPQTQTDSLPAGYYLVCSGTQSVPVLVP